MSIERFLTLLEAALQHGLSTKQWDDWKAVQDRHLTDDLMQRMSDEQRVRLHELTHGFVLLADPDGTWSDRLSERLEREYRASLVSTGT